MTDPNPSACLEVRYRCALGRTAPKLAVNEASFATEGTWIGDDVYLFLHERASASLGRLDGIPCLAECRTQTVRELAGCGSQSLVDSAQRVLARQSALEAPALYSPDGRHACFVREHNLWLESCLSGSEQQLTVDGELHYGYAEQPETSLAANSESTRTQAVGLWSRDSQWFVTHRLDERHVPELALVQNVPPDGGRPRLHRYKYAIPGDPLPTAHLIAFHIESGRRILFREFEMIVSGFSPFSLQRVWFDGSSTVWLLRMDRYCKCAELVRLDLRTGSGRVVLSESASSGYLDLHPMTPGIPNVRTLARTDEVIWFSERDGRGHLYLYDASTGQLTNQITAGEFQVRDIVHVDEQRRRILLLAGGIDPAADPSHRCLCAVNFDGSGFEVLLAHAGDVYVPIDGPSGPAQERPGSLRGLTQGVSPSGRFVVTRLASIEGGSLTQILDLQSRRTFPLCHTGPADSADAVRRFTALAADGFTTLHGVLFLPPQFDPALRYPLIDCIYPGPQVTCHPQAVNDLIASQARALAQLGFVTMMLDTRGTPLRDRAFHQAGYGSLLEPQLADHCAVVLSLCQENPWIEADRIGIIGHSAGGAAAARALFDYADVFKVAVSVCGNHDSSYYAAFWSDKYRGPPPQASWESQANRSAAHRLAGQLLLISGDMDENVHVGQTQSLVNALIEANKDFELLIVPNASHLVLMTNGYAQRRAWDFLVRHLLYKEPPREFEIRFEAHELDGFAARYAREIWEA